MGHVKDVLSNTRDQGLLATYVGAQCRGHIIGNDGGKFGAHCDLPMEVILDTRRK